MKIRNFLGSGLAVAILLSAHTAYADQGWSAGQQKDFYITDQGSRMIPLRWLQALKQSDHKAPFLADSLSRYGYLPNPESPVANLPVGFSAPGGDTNNAVVGMTCAACHTREIRVDGKPVRIEGGPALANFWAFMTDLDAAMTYALNDGWSDFAKAVPEPTDKTKLREAVTSWYRRYNTIVARSLPGTYWGNGRLDAVSMIYNRLTGLDLGDPNDSHIIAENMLPAIAPVRYPFLWNASRQDKTQWPGFGNQTTKLVTIHVGILGRNVGEVLGVFGDFVPTKSPLHLYGVNYRKNSVQIDNLHRLEDLIIALNPPTIPTVTAPPRVERGKQIYTDYCLHCHALPSGRDIASWKTPIQNVHTDGAQWIVLGRKANPGALTDTRPPFSSKRLTNPDASFAVLAQSVTGIIAQHIAGPVPLAVQPPSPDASEAANREDPDIKELGEVLPLPTEQKTFCEEGYAPPCYESRVLYGIWAAAPYLHNGSVPTLWDLLMPADKRPAQFEVGGDYDLTNVGLAKQQTGLKTTYVTTGCENPTSGNSRCGHEFGVDLSDDDKWALLEFLKSL